MQITPNVRYLLTSTIPQVLKPTGNAPLNTLPSAFQAAVSPNTAQSPTATFAAGTAKLREKRRSPLAPIAFLGAPFGWIGMFKAILGLGVAHPIVQAAGFASAAAGAIMGLKSLTTSYTPQEMNEVLKESNAGNDLDPNVATDLARDYNHMNRVNGVLAIANSAATIAALQTGNWMAGVGAFAIKLFAFGYGVYGTGKWLVSAMKATQPPQTQNPLQSTQP